MLSDDDVDIASAYHSMLPRANVVHSSQRGKMLSEIDERTLEVWANPSEKHFKFPDLIIQATIVLVHKYHIPYLREEGYSDAEIAQECLEQGFIGTFAQNHTGLI